ncbi:MAG: hypothetical protein U0350_36440 [Caldilineaceae bacterium]
MQNGNNSTPVIVLAVIGFICVAVWWIESRFGTHITGYVLLGLGLVLALVVGWILSLTTMKTTLNAQIDFNRQDAQVDRYRQQSFKALATGEAAERKADAQLRVLDARRVDQIANQRAKALLDVQQERWRLQQQQRDLASTPAQAEDDWWTTDPLQEDGWE